MANPHASMSSSVYSAVSGPKGHVSGVSGGIFASVAEEDERFGSDYNSSENESVYSELSRSHATEMHHDRSNQTFGTFVTANGSVPSFTSINNSLLRTESPSQDNTLMHDHDETPRLTQSATYDDVDKTPLIGAWPDDAVDSRPSTGDRSGVSGQNSTIEKGPQIDSATQYPPTLLASGYRQDTHNDTGDSLEPSELASKFQRLSMTLLQNGSKVSEESQQFQLDFSSNVHRENTSATSQPGRTSSYYNRISAKPRSNSDASPVKRSASDASKRSKQSTASSNWGEQSNDSANYTQDLHRTVSTASSSAAHDYSGGGLNISFNHENNGAQQMPGSETPLASARYSVASSAEVHDIDMSVLFIKALHSFDATQSQQESDNSVCLSFAENDLAFVHTIDDSGWGEVTLLDTLDRGWIPMNFFAVAVNEDLDSSGALSYAHYMGPLLDSCGKFLSNPISHTTRHGTKTFSIKIVNSVRDGVRRLLQETDCLSRSNEIVIKKPVVRKSRKSLLSDWYNLMMKAAEYKGTSNYDKIEVLTLLVFQVTRRATAFFDIWAKESQEIIKRDTEVSLRDDMEKYPLLRTAPNARQRVAEINSVLYSYLSLIIGRLDLVEHNPAGCDLLETMVHHIILLLRELLFISKTGSDYFSEKPPELDGSLDSLLSLVSEIVTGVKSLVINTLNEPEKHRSFVHGIHSKDQYSHTGEGKALIMIAAKMIESIASTIHCIRKTFEPIGDYKLSSERAYPDYSKIRIAPDEFIRNCSVGIVKSLSLNVRDLRELKQKNEKSSNRYSTFRSGKSGELGITANGINSLHKAVLVDTEASAPFGAGKEFKQYLPSSDSAAQADTFSIKDELLVDANGNLLGASFKGLVYTLTNESSPPEYFFVSAFFICFRNFASGFDLADSLIQRFECDPSTDATSSTADVSFAVKLKNRQKIVCKLFQIWMESYWDHKNDQIYLSTLINFFNEGVCKVLPFEGMKLIEIAARLVTQVGPSSQFLNRSISLAKIKRKNSLLPKSDSDGSLASRYSMIDGYELSKINTNSSVTSSLKSMTLPLPLGISGQTTSTSSLLTKNQLHAIETLVTTYRSILAENWVHRNLLDSQTFVIADISNLLPKWYALSDQNWVLSNYRPNLLDFNGLEIAKQFTLIESEIFCSIQASELVNGNFSAKKAHLNLAKNVRQSLLFTNCLSAYVVESVLQPQVSHKVRVNTIKTWLKIAISCLYLRNFNSLAAIITSLQSHLITRLTRLWGDLSEKYTELYEYLCCIVHPEKNYSVYRTKLKSFLLSNEYNIPVVPYFSLFLQDLTFVTDGNPNYRTANTFLKQKLINIDKYLKITRVIADIESLQISYVKDGGNHPVRSGTLFSLGHSKRKESHALNGLEEYSIASVPALKELILLELWKVSQVNKKEDDRAWKLSCVVQPRDTPQD
ncbi:hypothetical protein OXX79_000860 [Metschnikowia pulcherrima]